MKRINVVEVGAVADGKTSCSAVLQEIFNANKRDFEIYFPPGRYFMDKAVYAVGVDNCTMCGEDATILTHFTATGDKPENNNGFEFTN